MDSVVTISPVLLASSNTFLCIPCDGTSAHATVWPGGVLALGSYTLTVLILGFPLTLSFQVFNFFAGVEFPLGAALAVLVPLAGPFAFTRIKGIQLFK